jgi:hypothetical protein
MDQQTKNPQSQPPTGSSKNSEGWRPPEPTCRDQADPSRSAWISALSRQVLSSYRRDDFADPDAFLVQLGVVLERYPDDIIRDVTSPLTGIQRKYKFPPALAEVVEFCDGEVARREKISRYTAMGEIRREARAPQHLGNVFVPPDAPQYGAMIERAKKGSANEWRHDEERPGIWVPLGWLEEVKAMPTTQQFRRLTGDELRALYGGKNSEDAA